MQPALQFFDEAPKISMSSLGSFQVSGVGMGQNLFLPYGVFHKWGVPKNCWFVMENPTKMDDLGVPPFQETSIWLRE